MIYLDVSGDITSNIDCPTIICQCCNDIGKMGKGLAFTIARKWPVVERSYIRWKRSNYELSPFKQGQIQLVRVDDNITVCNIIGQSGIYPYRGLAPVRYDAIHEGMLRLAEALEKMPSLPVLRIPRLGCGLAGGEWPRVEKIVRKTFENIDIKILAFEPIKAGIPQQMAR